MIALRHVVMRLPAGGRALTILDDVTLDIPSKQFVAVVGPSGSGKSTLLGLIAGLDTPTSGTITLDGVELTGLGEDALATVRLDKVGVAARAHHYPVQLSGGEQQRAALARACARRPPVLLADEPTGNLDSASGEQVIALLRRLHRERGSTLVLVTHDRALAASADRVITLRDGRVVGDTAAGPA